MCGLFGMLRCPDAARPGDASQALVLLGVLAEERGPHAAGVALLTGKASRRPAPAEAGRFADVRLPGGSRVVKTRGAFSRLWRPALDRDLDHAVLALGHTRWATQGGRSLASASPLLASTLAGTHNGDIDAAAARRRFGLPAAPGGTDSELIFAALARETSHGGRVKVLASLTGRAAVAWADRSEPGRVYLARAALNPLVVASDADGNLWWASNPQWLRIVQRETSVRFRRMLLLAEGTYAVLAAGQPLRLLARRSFTPVARPWDVRVQGVWRGYTDADKARAAQPDMVRRRVTAVAASPRWRSLTA